MRGATRTFGIRPKNPHWNRGYQYDKCLCDKPKNKKSVRCIECARGLGDTRMSVIPHVAAYAKGKPVMLKLSDLPENWRVSAMPEVVVLIEALLKSPDGELELVHKVDEN